MQLNNANNWAHRANRCNALHSDEPAGRTSVTETLIVCNRSQSNKQVHAQIYAEKILEYTVFAVEGHATDQLTELWSNIKQK